MCSFIPDVPTWLVGRHGLIATCSKFLTGMGWGSSTFPRFSLGVSRMLLIDGELDGVRRLAFATIELMTRTPMSATPLGGSCNTTCIIAHQRWLALTGALASGTPGPPGAGLRRRSYRETCVLSRSDSSPMVRPGHGAGGINPRR